MAIILQLTEQDKTNLINHHMNQKTNDENFFIFNLKTYNFKSKYYLKSYITNKYKTVEGVLLSTVGPQKRVY